jgi:hypothetical protein
MISIFQSACNELATTSSQFYVILGEIGSVGVTGLAAAECRLGRACRLVIATAMNVEPA